MSKEPLINSIEKIMDIKEDLRGSIERQGVPISLDTPLKDYPKKVREITWKPPVIAEPKYLNFYDYDGTILYSYDKEEVDNLTELPVPPGKENLVFAGWNWTLEEIKNEGKKVNVGALYRDAYGYDLVISFTYTNTKSFNPIMFIYGYANDVDIFWGDGSTDHLGDTKGQAGQIYHTYSGPGQYDFKVKVNGSLYIGAGSSFGFQNPMHGINWYDVTYLYIGNVRFHSDAFQDLYNLESVVLSPESQYIQDTSGDGYQNFLINTRRLNHVNFPRWTYINCLLYSSIRTMSLPGNLSFIGQHSFSGCKNLHSYIIPNSVYGNSSTDCPQGVTELLLGPRCECPHISGVNFLEELKIYYNSKNLTIYTISGTSSLIKLDLTDFTTVPRIYDVNRTFLYNNCDFVVKDSMVNSFKTHSQWSTFANRIYGETEYNNRT